MPVSTGSHLVSATIYPGANDIVLAFADDQGAPLNLISMANNNQQSVATQCAGGTGVTYTFGGQTTPSQPPRSTPDVLQAALQALSSVGSGNMTVSGFGPYLCEFVSALGGAVQTAITTTPSGLLAALPAAGTTIGTSSATVNPSLGATFALIGTGWSAGFGSQGQSWYKCVNVGTGQNYARWKATGLSVSGLYSLGMIAVDPTAAEFSGPTADNSDVGTLQRFHVYDATTPPTYRGTVTASPRLDATGQHPYFFFGTFLCTSGGLNIYSGDDADSGGAVYAGTVVAFPAYTQLDTFPIPASWPSGAADRTISVQFTVRALGADKCLFSYGSYGGSGRETLYVTAAGKVAYKNAGISPVVGATTLVAGTTYLLTYTMTGGAANLYLNGTLEVGPSAAGSVNTNGSGIHSGAAVGIPVVGDSVASWDGAIGRAGVWGRVLTAGEVTTLYNAGSVLAYAALAGSLLTSLDSYYDCASTAPGVDGTAAVPLYSYLGAQPVENYGSTNMLVTQVRAGGAFGFSVVGPGAGTTLDATPLFSNGAVDFNRRPWVFFRTSAAMSPADVATVSIGANQVITNNGPLGAVVNFPVLNKTGGSVLPLLPKAIRSLRVGYNVSVTPWYQGLHVYANLCYGWSPWIGNGVLLSIDAQGNPNASFANSGAGGSPLALITKWITYSNPFGPDPAGEPIQPFGHFTLKWDGTEPNLTFSTATRGGAFVGGQSRVWDLVSGPAVVGSTHTLVADYVPGRELSSQGANPPMYDPFVQIVYPSNASFKSVTNVRVYPPGIDASNPPLFNPAFLALMAGSKCFRDMTWLATNGALLTQSSEFLADGELPGDQHNRYITVTHLDSYPYSTSNVWSRAAGNGWNGFALKVTTATPHGLHAGTSVGFFHADGLTGYGEFTDAGSGGHTFLSQGPLCYPLDATTFVFTAPTNDVMNYAASDMQIIHKPITYSFADACRFNNAIGPDCVLWHNVSHGATDLCIAAQGTTAAGILKHGNEVLLEQSNEPWNFQNAFTQYTFFISIGRWAPNLTAVSTPPNPFGSMGLGPNQIDNAQAYVLRAAQARYQFQTAWNLAGRTEPVRLVLNIRSGDISGVQHYLDYARDNDIFGVPCATNGVPIGGYSGPGPIRVDGVCVAPYFDIQPRHNPGDSNTPVVPVALVNALTLEQFVDVADANFANLDHNYWFTNPRGILAAIRAHNHPDAATIKMHFYEGGPGYNGLQDDQDQQQINSLALPFHPRSYYQYLAYLKAMDDTIDTPGNTYYAEYGHNFGYALEGTGPPGFGNALYPNYTTWYGMDWDGVVGNGSDGFANSLVPNVISDSITKKAKIAVLRGVTTPGAATTKTVGSVRGGATKLWNSLLTLLVATAPAATPPGNGQAVQRLWKTRFRRAR